MEQTSEQKNEQNMPPRKLVRSVKNKMISGIIGGLGEYANVDATLLRLLWVVFVIFTGVFPGVLLYIVAMLVIPQGQA